MGMTRVARLADKLTRKGESMSMVSEAIDRFTEWTNAHELSPLNCSPETFTWVREAFVDGYLRGMQKKITGE